VILPPEYIVQKFYQYAGFPKYKKLSKTHEACCPICREGKSWGRKKRCYYIVDKSVICCHNCGWYSSAAKWIMQVTGMQYDEMCKESQDYDILPLDVMQEQNCNITQKLSVLQHVLPLDSINLYDENQIRYHSREPVVVDALALIRQRMLDKAINRPETLWLSLTDKVHKNRIIIPFYDDSGNIIFYQTRAIYNRDTLYRPKYLGKINGERSLFNINKVDPALEYMFIFESPIDAFFVKNGIAVAGIQEKSTKTFTQLQENQLSTYRLYNKIWVLDSQWLDSASYKKTEILIENGETVFIWPENIGKQFKDINDLCIACKRYEILPSLFIKNSYQGIKAKLLLKDISR